MIQREIKFRTWHLGDKHKKSASIMLYDERPGDYLIWKSQAQDIDHVMQYTGKKDKNGKEIYEGDIVLDADYDKYIITYNTNDMCFYLSDDSGNHNSIDYLRQHYTKGGIIEVIGNIYENPELL